MNPIFFIIAVSYSEALMISVRRPSDDSSKKAEDHEQQVTRSQKYHPANMNTEKYFLTQEIFLCVSFLPYFHTDFFYCAYSENEE